MFGNSWFHSVDENEKGCAEDCKELPHPEECNDKKAMKKCAKLKDREGPMKVCMRLFIPLDPKLPFNPSEMPCNNEQCRHRHAVHGLLVRHLQHEY